MRWHSTSNFSGYKIRILAGCWADSDLVAHWNIQILVGKNIRFWQAVVQTRVWLLFKNAATVHHIFILSVFNSTVYWLQCINNYIHHNCVRYHSQQRNRLPVDQHIWRQSCLDTLCWNNSTADWAYKIATNVIPRRSKTRVNRYCCHPTHINNKYCSYNIIKY